MTARVADPVADRALIEASQATTGTSVDYTTWLRHAEAPASRMWLDDATTPVKFMHVDLWRPGHAQIVWWTPMAVTDDAEFLLTLPVLLFACQSLVGEFGAAARTWPIWGFAPRLVAQAWATRFGPIVVAEAGDAATTLPDFPKVGNTYRARSTIQPIAVRCVELLA